MCVLKLRLVLWIFGFQLDIKISSKWFEGQKNIIMNESLQSLKNLSPILIFHFNDKFIVKQTITIFLLYFQPYWISYIFKATKIVDRCLTNRKNERINLCKNDLVKFLSINFQFYFSKQNIIKYGDNYLHDVGIFVGAQSGNGDFFWLGRVWFVWSRFGIGGFVIVNLKYAGLIGGKLILKVGSSNFLRYRCRFCAALKEILHYSFTWIS